MTNEKELPADAPISTKSDTAALDDHESPTSNHEMNYAELAPSLAPSPSRRSHPEPDINATDIELARIESRKPVHSVFSKHQKWFIVFMAAWGGFFSPLSANIYLPALNVLSKDLQVSSSTINLTLTAYMIFQGLAPTFMGNFADDAGRRPAYIICFVIYIGANIGLALQRDYAALLVLRCLQSSGSSSTIALASGVVADIATAAERGTWMGFALAGSLLGPAIGPILGGLLSQYLGWPAIFWFLCIFSGIYLATFILAFPETGRKIVGDGSVPPPKLNWSLPNYLTHRKLLLQTGPSSAPSAPDDPDPRSPPLGRTRTHESLERQKRRLAANRHISVPNPLRTLRILGEKDVALLLFYNALVYTAFMVVASSTPSLFATMYGFSELQIGLAFLPYGVACCLATWTWGKLLDVNFARTARALGVAVERTRAMDLREFPLERARLQLGLPLVYVGAAVMLCYGWALEYEAPLGVVLVLQFLIGLFVSGGFNVMSTMMVDLYPQSPATATACNNLVRCLIGAGGTAAIIPMIDAMGRGWCFTFIALVITCFSPMAWVIYFKGMGWREERRLRLQHEKEKQSKTMSG